MITLALVFLAIVTLAGISYIALRLVMSAGRIGKKKKYGKVGIIAIVISLYGMYIDVIYHCFALEKCSLGEECYACLAIFFIFALIGIAGFYMIRR